MAALHLSPACAGREAVSASIWTIAENGEDGGPDLAPIRSHTDLARLFLWAEDNRATLALWAAQETARGFHVIKGRIFGYRIRRMAAQSCVEFCAVFPTVSAARAWAQMP